jgi:hypothetical protein
MLERYFGLPISTRYDKTRIIIQYDDNFKRTPIKTFESNMLYQCFLKVCELHNITDEYYPIFGTLYMHEFTEKVTEAMYNEFNVQFFGSMDAKFEKILNMFFCAMDLPIAKFFGSSDYRRFNVFKYFMDFEEIPEVSNFYKYDTYETRDCVVNEFRNIENTEKYQIVDFSVAKIKRYANLKNKYILKSNDSIIKRFVRYDDAFDYLKAQIQMVKTLD